MSASVWIQAARPKTLPAALAPVALGTGCAAGAGSGANFAAATFAALFALFAQVACNLANDLGDYKRGADTPERAGPVRVTASGLAAPTAVRRAAIVAAVAAFVSGLGLVFFGTGGVWLVPVGVVCIAAALAYTEGPFPLAYHGLGDAFVLVFFGFVAVLFTCYTQCGEFPLPAWFAGAGCGLLAVNILVVNNARDMETDAAAGKRTLVVRFGRGFARVEYALCVALALASLTLAAGADARAFIVAGVLGIPALALVRAFLRVDVRRRADYNPLLGKSAAFLLLAGSVFTALLLAR